jgi:hypothetical protein
VPTPSATAKQIAATAVGTGSGLLLTTHLPLVAGLTIGLLAVLFAGVFLGVVLPAVWSTRPTRRAAAQTVLTQILALLRPDPPALSQSPGPSDPPRRRRGPGRPPDPAGPGSYPA